MRRSSDITGQRFGQLTVIGFSHRTRHKGGTHLLWRCVCDCGSICIKRGNALRMGRATDCGYCPRPGGNRTDWPGYTSLKGAIGRCLNPNNRAYKDYGGRGISVCDRWRFGDGKQTGFECFIEDMGERPGQKYSLDRIDVDGDYEPNNCRWATKKQQQQNQRRAIYAGIGGVGVPLKKYVARTGLCYESVRFRVRKRGETVLEAARHLLNKEAAS